MDKKVLEAFPLEAAKSINTPSDLDDFRKMLTKVTVETALNTEFDEHLGYEKHSPTHNSNSRNGYSSKPKRQVNPT
jgi:putative transposase